MQRYGMGRRTVAVVNCRADRPDRSRQLAEACRQWTPADHYLAVGSATQLFAERASRLGVAPSAITCAEHQSAAALLPTLRQLAGSNALVMGMGNISGPGMELVDHFRHLQVGRAVGDATRFCSLNACPSPTICCCERLPDG